MYLCNYVTQRKENQSAQVTHLIIPKTENNTCDVNLECLFGLANGLFIINENCEYTSIF